MQNKFPIKLALIIAVSCAAPALGQDRQLTPIDQTVEDVEELSTSFRYIEQGLIQPSGFNQVYRYTGRTDFFVRIDGAIHAVFPKSVYQPSKQGINAAVPPGTVFYIGDPLLQSAFGGNVPQQVQAEGPEGNDFSGRLMWRVEPQLDMPAQHIKRNIGTKRVRVDDSSATDRRSMSGLKESDAPDIVANSTYRNDRIHTLMKKAAGAAKKRSDNSGSSSAN